ncbi:hypothetical protein C2E23DRAFT_810374 [Lenzites betulinus]|nr:hypothetical protein C2E23DRAFT_810374 [Lenzites betulinus]
MANFLRRSQDNLERRKSKEFSRSQLSPCRFCLFCAFRPTRGTLISAATVKMAFTALNKGLLTSYLVFFFLDCLFFGVFFVAYAITIWLLIFNDRRRHGQTLARDRAQAALLSVMLLLAFTYMVLDVVANVHAFETNGGDLSAAEQAFSITNPKSLWGPKLGVLVTQTLLADGYLIYRLYIVWGRSLAVIVAPTFFLVCDAAFGFAMVHYQIHPEENHPPGAPASLSSIMTTAFLASSLTTNVISTGLIAARIIRSSNRVRDIRVTTTSWGSSQASRLVDIIVQSAAVYACALVVVLIAMYTAVDEPLVVLGILPSIAGAVFSIVIIRSRLSNAASDSHQATVADLRTHPRMAPPRRKVSNLSIAVSHEVISHEDTK